MGQNIAQVHGFQNEEFSISCKFFNSKSKEAHIKFDLRTGLLTRIRGHIRIISNFLRCFFSILLPSVFIVSLQFESFV